MIIKEELLASLEKIELGIQDDKSYIFVFKKIEWLHNEVQTFANYIYQKYPNVHMLTTLTDSGHLEIHELSREEKIELINKLVNSL